MSKIRLVVEIDEKRYESICDGVEKSKKVNVPSLYAHKIIANGIPLDDVLDKIRTEISDFEKEIFQRPNTDYSDYAAVRHCLEIIDKYRNEESKE